MKHIETEKKTHLKHVERHDIPDFTSVLIYLFWSFGINTFSDENWIPILPVPGGVRDVVIVIIFILHEKKNSIKSSLQFSQINFRLDAFEGSMFTRIFTFLKNTIIVKRVLFVVTICSYFFYSEQKTQQLTWS